MTFSVMQVIGKSDIVGGAERHLVDLIHGLLQRDIEVEVITTGAGTLTDQLKTEHIPVRTVEMVYPSQDKKYTLNRETLRTLISWMNEGKPDIVHSHLFSAHLHASMAAKKAKMPTVIHTAQNLTVRHENVWLSHQVPVYTIAVSKAVAMQHINAGVSAQNIEVIYNGVASSFFEIPNEGLQNLRSSLSIGEEPIIGTVARLSPEKGLDVLLQATADLINRGLHLSLLIVGEGREAMRLRNLSVELGIQQAVHFLGYRKDVALLNHIFDIFVLPSRHEGCSLALLEAMAAGRPVVATNVGGSPEVILSGVDGYIIPMNDAISLSNTIQLLLADKQHRISIGKAARRKVAAEFTLQKTIEDTVKVYLKLLGVKQDNHRRI